MEDKHYERLLIREVAEGYWSIDENGCIWKLHIRSGRGTTRLGTPRRAEHSDGRYLRVSSKRDGVEIVAGAHRLVWQHFYGDIPDGMQINHINGVKIDNHPKNLELTTPKENTHHALKLGLSVVRGEANGNSRLAPKIVNGIRELYASGWTIAELAELFNVCRSTISGIVHGECWAHLLESA